MLQRQRKIITESVREDLHLGIHSNASSLLPDSAAAFTSLLRRSHILNLRSKKVGYERKD